MTQQQQQQQQQQQNHYRHMSLELLVKFLLLCHVIGSSSSTCSLQCFVGSGSLFLKFSGIHEFLAAEQGNNKNGSSRSTFNISVEVKGLPCSSKHHNNVEDRTMDTISHEQNKLLQISTAEGVITWKVGYIFDDNFFFNFRITKTSQTGQKWETKKETISNFSLPNNETVDTWEEGFRFADIERCLDNRDSYYMVKGDCKKLSIWVAEYIYTQRDFGTFQVNQKSFDFYAKNSCLDYMCKYEGDLLVANKNNSICFTVYKNRKLQRICKSIYAYCPPEKVDDKSGEKHEDGQGKYPTEITTLLISIILGIVLVASCSCNFYLYGKTKQSYMRQQSEEKSVPDIEAAPVYESIENF